MDTNREEIKNWLAAMGHNLDQIPEPRYDFRHIKNGTVIPTQGYADQPYIVKTNDGAWVCVVTTGTGAEGQAGQHVCVLRSYDKGKTWSDPIALEDPDGVEASYAVMLKTPSGRLYCFYNHNTDNMREVISEPGTFRNGMCQRVDSLGYFVFKYSDDHGKTWSKDRYPIDVREMEIDRNNAYSGKVRFFWNVGKPFIHEEIAYVSLHKVGGFGEGFFTKNEGVLLKSDNLLTEKDPEKIRFETLPDGEVGLRTPPGGGPISSEQSYSVMSDGSFFCVYRSVDGHPVCAYSRDKGLHWNEIEYMTYTTGGKRFKHPRAANFAWKCSNGKYLYWFHNHGGRDYNDRNPVWLCCGVEAPTDSGLKIEWSLPEIVLYDDDTFIRMSYPDMVEEDGDFFLTETQKNIARVHKLDPDFMRKIFSFNDTPSIVTDGLILELDENKCSHKQAYVPKLPPFLVRDPFDPAHKGMNMNAGLTFDLSFELETLDLEITLLDNRNENEKGFIITTDTNERIVIEINDGRSISKWKSDPGTIKSNILQKVAIIIDGGPGIISFITNGDFNDGGTHRQFGWGRLNPHFRDLNSAPKLRIASDIKGKIFSIRLYDRALMSNEIAQNHRAT